MLDVEVIDDPAAAIAALDPVRADILAMVTSRGVVFDDDHVNLVLMF